MVSQDDMNRIFEVIDALGISREAIRVPLKPAGGGSVERLDDGQFKIIVPDEVPLADWLPQLRAELEAL